MEDHRLEIEQIQNYTMLWNRLHHMKVVHNTGSFKLKGDTPLVFTERQLNVISCIGVWLSGSDWIKNQVYYLEGIFNLRL